MGREHLTFTVKIWRWFWFQSCFILNNGIKAPLFSCFLSLNTPTVMIGYISSQVYGLQKRTDNFWQHSQFRRLIMVNLCINQPCFIHVGLLFTSSWLCEQYSVLRFHKVWSDLAACCNSAYVVFLITSSFLILVLNTLVTGFLAL